VAARDEARRDVRLEVKLGPAPAVGDLRLAESLIANLADNALRYNAPGGWAEVSTATRDGRAAVSVRNTGPAIPPGHVDGLFQPFQRLGTERVPRSRGHGLGLAIVRAIAEATPPRPPRARARAAASTSPSPFRPLTDPRGTDLVLRR
jgi:signal transduction histidine kinase